MDCFFIKRIRFFIPLLPAFFLHSGLLAQDSPDVPLPEAPAAEARAEARISFFDVALKNQAVEISWETEPEGISVVLYRSTQPFEDMAALAQAMIVAANEEALSPYIDYPVPGVPYYYAAVPQAAVRSGTVVFKYGENTNEMPVEVLGEYTRPSPSRRASARNTPLPRLNPSGTAQAEPRAFSAEAEEIIAAISASASSYLAQEGRYVAEDMPYRFPEDARGSSSGEEAALKSILDSNFPSGNWEGLEADLSRFLSLRRTEKVTARARFYLGEARYFLGNYRRALEEFLLMRNAYPAKAGEWIQKALKKL